MSISVKKLIQLKEQEIFSYEKCIRVLQKEIKELSKREDDEVIHIVSADSSCY